MFKKTYNAMNERLVPERYLVETTLRYMEDAHNGIHWATPVRPRRMATVVTAVFLVLCISLTALVAPRLLDTASMAGAEGDSVITALAVEENNGLRVAVTDASASGDKLSVSYTLQDTDGTGRLSKNMDVIARLKLNEEFPVKNNELVNGAMWHSRVLDYDPDTQTAYCRMDFDTNGTYDVTGAQIGLELCYLLRSVERHNYVPLDTSAIQLEPETLSVWGIYRYYDNSHFPSYTQEVTEDVKYGFFHFTDYPEVQLTDSERKLRAALQDENGEWCVLNPQEDGAELPEMGGIKITAMGFLGGKLHMQSWTPGETEEWDEAYPQYEFICAKKGTGQQTSDQIAALYATGEPDDNDAAWALRSARDLGTISFDRDEAGQVIWGPAYGMPRYQETVFDITPEEMDDYEFFARGNILEQSNIDIQVKFDAE